MAIDDAAIKPDGSVDVAKLPAMERARWRIGQMLLAVQRESIAAQQRRFEDSMKAVLEVPVNGIHDDTEN